MSDMDKPLTAFTSQGWEVANYSAAADPSTGSLVHSFLMRRQGKSKLVIIRKKMLGESLVTEELEI
ncbi:hypothetical protein [Terricaulis silvestris]|uniref:Uncharacterized protein n=1 Tax=Terricaulis silvestris TaxID=2686094 RepID=A0A6I6MKN4_9CAUL|nr:hypothetical protein [Terricaulis silvestris]QGZ95239.1 hypothetical protein DSM104635_02083 [Terricaulis silvestris]